MSSFTPPGPLRIPVLITAFKRYDTTVRVLDAVRRAQPTRLYLAFDGPRNEEERIRTDQVRTLVEQVDWPCEVRTLFHERNKGTKYGMVENMDWFFRNEPEGIVLEDDILPSLSFFWFAQELLERYRDDERIWAIIGNNLATGGVEKDPDGYWFNAHGYGAYSGWAGWRRSWQRIDIEMQDWPAMAKDRKFQSHFLDRDERFEANMLFRFTHEGHIPGAWDYQFDYARIKAGAVNIIPNVNLCRNIGFGADATHSVSLDDPRNQEYLHEARFPLQHPQDIVVDEARNLSYFKAYILTPTLRRLRYAVTTRLPAPLERALTKAWDKLRSLR